MACLILDNVKQALFRELCIVPVFFRGQLLFAIKTTPLWAENAQDIGCFPQSFFVLDSFHQGPCLIFANAAVDFTI